MKATFSSFVINGIHEKIDQNLNHEVGGIIFGHFQNENVCFHSFRSLEDISSHFHEVFLSEKEAIELIKNHLDEKKSSKPIIGFWHNHLNEDSYLSQTDIDTGRQWAYYLSGSVILALFSKKKDHVPSTFVISDSGEVCELESIID
jgi:proteasome lid subunit RPN8/RPN11